MEKDRIRLKLIDYLDELKANLGYYKSFEVVFNYINFIKTEPYLKNLMEPFINKGDKKIKNIINTCEKEKNNFEKENNGYIETIEIDIKKFKNAINNISFLKEDFKKISDTIDDKENNNSVSFLDLRFTTLLAIHKKMKKIKSLQKQNKEKEARKIIEEIKEISLLFLPEIKSGDKILSKKATTTQIIHKNMFFVNKYILDEIDSQMFLDNERPKEKISFDRENSILYIEDFKIKVTRKNQKPIDHRVLEAIFDNYDLQSETPFSEILEVYFENDDKKTSRSFRGACDNLNKKIRKDTNNKINDFIKYTSGKTGWCKINPKYL